MSLRNSSRWIAAALALASLSASKTSAQDFFSPSGETNAADSLQVSLRSSQCAGAEPVHYALMALGTNRYCVGIPSGFRLDASTPEKIVLNNNESWFLTFRVLGPIPADTQDSKSDKPDIYHAELLRQHPTAAFVNEFSATAGGRSGPGLDAEWKNADGIPQAGRTAYIPSKAGILEFSLTTRPDNFPEGRHFFAIFLASFRSNNEGKLEIIQASDRN